MGSKTTCFLPELKKGDRFALAFSAIFRPGSGVHGEGHAVARLRACARTPFVKSAKGPVWRGIRTAADKTHACTRKTVQVERLIHSAICTNAFCSEI